MRGGGLGRKGRGRGRNPRVKPRWQKSTRKSAVREQSLAESRNVVRFFTSFRRVEWRRDGGLVRRRWSRGVLTSAGSAFHSTGPLIADISPLLTDIPGPT